MISAAIFLMLPLKLFAAQVSVAVAANFTAPMRVIVQEFEQETNHKVTLIFGATGQLYAQIRNGAPFAILLSADDKTPLTLEKEGFAVPGSHFIYAIGKLVLWSKKSDFVDAQGEILRSERFKKIAIANPKLAPYGVAAIETLEKMGLRDRIADKIVKGANITQTFQFISSENAQLGFIALSQVFEHGNLKEGSAWVVPALMYTPIRQSAVLLNSGKDNTAAIALLKYLQSDKARGVIRSFGYDL